MQSVPPGDRKRPAERAWGRSASMQATCANHPGAAVVGACRLCHKPICGGCAVEDVPSDSLYCSPACRAQWNARNATADADTLIEALRHPIQTGWRLWLRCSRPLTLQVGLPVGLVYALLAFVVLPLASSDGAANEGWRGLLRFAAGPFGIAATAVLLSRAHIGIEGANPWPLALSRFVPWVVTWLLLFGATLLGLLLFIIPGIVVGIRLFWADEFALMHGHGPAGAVRASTRLTRGLTGRVFGFQFVLGLAEYLALIPFVLGLIGVEMLAEAWGRGAAFEIASSVLLSVMLVHLYASMHASEIVYFYGLRALRSQLTASEARGDWVGRELRRRAEEVAAAARVPYAPGA